MSAVGVSGMSSSSDMGEGMRRLRSSSISCLVPFRAGGACIDGIGPFKLLLLMSMLPAEPLVGYPSPCMPPLLNVGCMGVGIRPLLAGSDPNKEGLSIAGRIKKFPDVPKAGDSGGWLRTSTSSSSISML